MGTTQEASTASSGTSSALAAPRRCPGMMKAGNQSDTTAAARFPSAASRERAAERSGAARASRGRPGRASPSPSSSSPCSTKACSRSDACG